MINGSMPEESAPSRVLHIVPALFGPQGVLGGAERYALELARHMADVVPTRLLTFGDQPRDQQIGNLHVRVTRAAWHVRGQRANPIGAAILPEVLASDVVHCHQQHILASSVAAALCNIAGRKAFITDLGGGGWDISAYLSTDRWYRAHLHISEYSRKVFHQEGQRWSYVILGGVDTGKFSPDPAILRDGTVLYVGRLLPHKGVDILIRALPDDMRLMVVGQPMHNDYFAELQRLAAGKNVSFHHDYSDADLVRSYRSALCVVLPSVYRDMYGEVSDVPELLGQTLLEGMACATPAICSDVASMPEIVEDGRSGFIVPPNDAETLREKLLWLRNHPDHARQMGQAARERILQKFTWPAVVQRCLEIYRRP